MLNMGQRESDSAVIEASGRDPEMFGLIYDRYAAMLYRFAFRRLGAEAAEDVVAETFLAAFRRRASYDIDRADARPWLFGILVKEISRHHRIEDARLRAAAALRAPRNDEGLADRVAEVVSAGAAGGVLAAALAELKGRDRDVLLLIAWSDLSYDETATALGIAIGTVRSRLNRARRQIREALGSTDPTRMTEES
ncbi:RNA polymerase sigma factor [Actinoplanes utahensis]|uniref:RNA polymerase sigma70 factor n=1 Tax=Actinoplanes utahensis TaxID=1869 RepID=A0A0A6XGV6_ACTUT|nr:RNA polymerase sigma factor [Actinoplanes utahensis]KHD79317.1 RNA polymerase sigma70 factor [Actinoplanes utahensis]